MGTLTVWIAKCPDCGEDVEMSDNSSAMHYGGRCACGWVETKDYYYTDETGGSLDLCTKEQAKKLGYDKISINH